MYWPAVTARAIPTLCWLGRGVGDCGEAFAIGVRIEHPQELIDRRSTAALPDIICWAQRITRLFTIRRIKHAQPIRSACARAVR